MAACCLLCSFTSVLTWCQGNPIHSIAGILAPILVSSFPAMHAPHAYKGPEPGDQSWVQRHGLASTACISRGMSVQVSLAPLLMPAGGPKGESAGVSRGSLWRQPGSHSDAADAQER